MEWFTFLISFWLIISKISSLQLSLMSIDFVILPSSKTNATGLADNNLSIDLSYAYSSGSSTKPKYSGIFLK